MKSFFEVKPAKTVYDEGVVTCFIDDDELLNFYERELKRDARKVGTLWEYKWVVNLTLHNYRGSYDYIKAIEKLKRIFGSRFFLDIVTSGNNIEGLMKAFNSPNERINVFVDDHDARDVLNDINLKDVRFNCLLSERYLLNLSDQDFADVCSKNNFKFDREKISQKRKFIKFVWEDIISDIGNLKFFDEKERVTLILNYVRENINAENQVSSSESCETLKRKNMVAEKQAKLASMLLDNYLTRVDCHVVEGFHLPTATKHFWIVTKIDGKKYGHCLTMPKYFKNLLSYGYVRGNISLEDLHKSRSDYTIEIDDYSQLEFFENTYLGNIILNHKVNSVKNIDSTTNEAKRRVSNISEGSRQTPQEDLDIKKFVYMKYNN